MAERRPTPAKVLLVMEEDLASLVSLALLHGPFITRWVASLADAERLTETWRPELCIVVTDGSAAGGTGSLGGRSDGIPFIALTRKRDLPSRLAAFERGADDVLALPIDPEELLARALALVRRAYGGQLTFAPSITVGEMRIDVVRGTVTVAGRNVRLTPLELRLLYVLAANGGRTMSRQRIFDLVWGIDHIASSNVIDRHIRTLRAKLGDRARLPRVIRTVAGEGYAIVVSGHGSNGDGRNGKGQNGRASAGAKPGGRARQGTAGS